MTQYYDDIGKKLLARGIPMYRLCLPEDIANAVLGILMQTYMTGKNLILHGGREPLAK